MILNTVGAFSMDLLGIIVSPEYGAEAIKVVAVYLMFRKDIKELGKKVVEQGQKADNHRTEDQKKFEHFRSEIDDIKTNVDRLKAKGD